MVFNKMLIGGLPIPCTCSPPMQFTACLIGSAFGIWSEVCVGIFWGNSQRFKPVGCFCRGALPLMFDGILIVTLSEEKISTTGSIQGNHKLPLPPNYLDSHQTQKQ